MSETVETTTPEDCFLSQCYLYSVRSEVLIRPEVHVNLLDSHISDQPRQRLMIRGISKRLCNNSKPSAVFGQPDEQRACRAC